MNVFSPPVLPSVRLANGVLAPDFLPSRPVAPTAAIKVRPKNRSGAVQNVRRDVGKFMEILPFRFRAAPESCCFDFTQGTSLTPESRPSSFPNDISVSGHHALRLSSIGIRACAAVASSTDVRRPPRSWVQAAASARRHQAAEGTVMHELDCTHYRCDPKSGASTQRMWRSIFLEIRRRIVLAHARRVRSSALARFPTEFEVCRCRFRPGRMRCCSSSGM